MISYLTEFMLCLGICYLFYILALRKETFFRLNRWYLLGTLFICALIPFWEIPLVSSVEDSLASTAYFEPITVTVQALEQNLEEIVVTPVSDTFEFQNILWWIYGLGVLFFASRFMAGLWQMARLVYKGKREKKEGYFIIHTQQVHLPFSFFNYLFWSEKVEFTPTDQSKILRHELSHIREGHSYDVIFTEFLCIFLWINPFVFLYQKALRNIHEYLADAAVLRDTPTRHYGQLLLRQVQSGRQLALANHFIHSQLKKRIIMMTKNKSRQRSLLKYATILPILLVLVLIFSRKEMLANFDAQSITELVSDSDFDKEAVKQKIVAVLARYHDEKTTAHQEVIFLKATNLAQQLMEKYPDHDVAIASITDAVASDLKVPFKFTWSGGNPQLVKHHATGDQEFMKVVEEMPRFPGCESETDLSFRDRCAQKKMLEFIYSNIKYPKEAITNDIQGTVAIRFVVEENGQLSGLEIKRGIGGGCDEEVLRVARKMPLWTPGKQKGEAVPVEFVLPVKFKLDAKKANTTKKKPTPPTPPTPEEGDIFRVVQDMPRFPGCEAETDVEVRKKCAQKKMLEFIYSNVQYPANAKEQGIEGTTVVRFIINKAGQIEHPEMLREIGGGTSEEVLRIVKMMNHMEESWIPGKQSGKKVAVYYNLPIKFKLASKPAEPTKQTAPTPATSSFKFKKFQVYPNPTTDKLNLEFEVQQSPVTLVITDINGRVILKKVYTEQKVSLTDIDISQAAKGTILISLHLDGQVETKAVIKQ